MPSAASPEAINRSFFEQLKLREIAKNNREGREREHREKGAKQLKLFVFALN